MIFNHYSKVSNKNYNVNEITIIQNKLNMILCKQKELIVYDNLGISNDVEIKIKSKTKEELEILKFWGPSHKNGIDWTEIENSFMNTETENIINIADEIEGIPVFQARIMDAGFIDRLIVLEKKYKDNMKIFFTGESYNENIKKINQIFEKTKNTLINKFESIFEEFFSEKNNINNFSFSKELFHKNIEGIIDEKRNILNKNIAKNESEWYSYRTFNNNKKNFSILLENDYLNDNYNIEKIENMDYKNIQILAKAIQEINIDLNNGFIHSALVSNEQVGSYLGQANLKGQFIVSKTRISSKVGESFIKALDRKISMTLDRIIENRKEKYSEMNIADRNPINENKVLKIIHEFKLLNDTYDQDFREIYMKKMEILDDFSKKSISNNWNHFIDNMDFENKKQFLIPTNSYSIINLVG